MEKNKEKSIEAGKAIEPIQLTDLLPRQNVKGGAGSPRVIFGSMTESNRKRRGHSGH